MDRFLSIALFAAAFLSFGGASLLLLNGFIEYLQTGSWTATSLLQTGYDSYLIRARWFLANQWSWWIHDVLEVIPTYAALLGIAPVCWWLSQRLDQR
jgi:hypothetical protein